MADNIRVFDGPARDGAAVLQKRGVGIAVSLPRRLFGQIGYGLPVTGDVGQLLGSGPLFDFSFRC